ncbi:hypothetical protein Dimus_004721 [Dionaea muscipula]
MDQSVLTRMRELRLGCEREIAMQKEKADSVLGSFRRSLQSIKETAQETAEEQEKLGKLKTQPRELEGELAKAIAEKTRREARKITISDSITRTHIEVEQLKQTLQELKVQESEYSTFVSRELDALASSEERIKKEIGRMDEMEGWYNRVLGLKIEGGRNRVKFTFTNIKKECPSEEFFFTICYANEMYTLLDCNPHLNDTEHLSHELNKPDGLSRFVRIVRERFLKAAELGSSPKCTPLPQISTTVPFSAPVSSVATDKRSETAIPPREFLKNSNAGRRVVTKLPIASPTSGLPVRRSARLKIGEFGEDVVTKLPIASPASGLPVRRSSRLKAKKC